MENKLILDNVTFSYPNSKKSIIQNFSLSVEKGSFTTLLGASGSGKTTILRLIAGFIKPDYGNIYISEKNVSSLPPEERNIGIVFQDYALFPHMTVEQNILYGLKVQNQKLKKIDRKSKTDMNNLLKNISEKLDLSSLLERYPGELSGGQQQRVALARSLILEPEILLMDEPLSSLDAKLRQTLRFELKEIQKKLNITTIYVTHDQEEALSLSDKVAVINNGSLIQYDTGFNLYFNPKDRFTAEFTGNANFMTLENKTWLVRPEWIKVSNKSSGNSLKSTLLNQDFLGNKIRLKLKYENEIIYADISSAQHTTFINNEILYLDILSKSEID